MKFEMIVRNSFDNLILIFFII